MRGSERKPLSTSAASAPTCSQTVASSFAKVTDIARKELSPCLTISAELNRHPDQVVTELAQQRLEDRPRALIADADDDPSGIAEHLDRPAKPQIFRRAGEGDGAAAGLTCECLLQRGDRADRKLR